MDNLVLEAAKQTPALAVLCFIVIKFLAHIDSRASANHTLFMTVNESIRQNSLVLGEMKGIIHGEKTASSERTNASTPDRSQLSRPERTSN